MSNVNQILETRIIQFSKLIAVNYHNEYLRNTVDIIKSYNSMTADLEYLYKALIINNNIKIIQDNSVYNFEKLYQDFTENKILRISNENCNHSFLSVNHNLIFRCIHDYIHFNSQEKNMFLNINFSFIGELQNYKESLYYFSEKSYLALFSEIIAQLCYFNYYQDFPVLQKCIDYSSIVNFKTLELTQKGKELYKAINDLI